MRAIWTGSIAFGLVNVPVKAYSAASDHDIDLHQVHDKDGGRIRYERRCEVCGKKITYQHIDKAYDTGEQTVVLTDEEMDALPSEKSREIDVVQFVPAEQIDPLTLERSYYLEPDSKSPKAYALLRRTLEQTELMAVVKFALRQKTRLGVLRVRDDVMVLQSMMWGDELREADFPAAHGAAKISPQELKMSAALVEQFTGDFDSSQFEDDYQNELRTLIDEKLKQGDALDTDATFGEAPAETESSGEVIDLMEALKRSIDSKRGGKAKAATRSKPAKDAEAEDEDADSGSGGKKTAAKKETATKGTKKSTATKTAAKNSSDEKTSTRKSTAKKTAQKKTETKKSAEKKPAAKKTAAKKPAAKKGTTSSAKKSTETKRPRKSA
ncbi:Ku protein [Glutamicibacter creatinolyticus]|uniref:Non-homologous end joining protein Ku n=1 Tax=Glutamicibacter creatinolyticus TaxID=162496 RepID=A0A5B7WXD4_9MICC|nr:Ku protein [Glutamicibacter creatinolyticus]QCY48589.1 Ku protein [Glutamicibacter creatinolyticus]